VDKSTIENYPVSESAPAPTTARRSPAKKAKPSHGILQNGTNGMGYVPGVANSLPPELTQDDLTRLLAGITKDARAFFREHSERLKRFQIEGEDSGVTPKEVIESRYVVGMLGEEMLRAQVAKALKHAPTGRGSTTEPKPARSKSGSR
jgi:hypothetical protein